MAGTVKGFEMSLSGGVTSRRKTGSRLGKKRDRQMDIEKNEETL